MSAALQLATVWGASNQELAWQAERRNWGRKPAARPETKPAKAPASEPVVSLAFYRRHTESMLRRYLYASMQVGRAPSILGDPVSRGWASSRPIRTFEDAVIFVLDLEKCLEQLGSLDRQLLSRIVLQEYTQAEAGTLLGMSVRAVSYKFPQALDRLTEKLLASGLLVLPH
ncbi:MAG TPA: sigma factor-like helix-turn-helix DNA-binding protein [Terracidiphilus sp.]|nr:sigma factor-like helix-turn-helix DNA-binding protein [Terracidiphilus sp.]